MCTLRAVPPIGVVVLICASFFAEPAHGQDRQLTIGAVSGQLGQRSEESFRHGSGYAVGTGATAGNVLLAFGID
jgi:hypothetical protein